MVLLGPVFMVNPYIGRLDTPRTNNDAVTQLPLRCRFGADDCLRHDEAMDWSWVPSTVTILATGAATTAGVWIKGILDGRADARRIAAEEKRAEQEHSWAEEREKGDHTRKSRAGQVESANSAMKVFGVILDSIDVADRDTALKVEHEWTSAWESQARQAVEFVYDGATRSDMGVVVDALADFSNYAKINNITGFQGYHGKWMIQTLLQLAGAASRGESISEELQTRVTQVRERLDALNSYFNENEPF